MTTPANNVDTTSGGGGDFDGGANDPQYRAPTDGVPDDDGVTQDTTGRFSTAQGQPDAPAPAHQDFDTTRGGGSDRNPADDPVYNNNPPTPTNAENRDTTQLGGGIGASVQQPYRAPSDPPAASNAETGQYAGFVNVNPGSPDAAVVGNSSGQNPNAVEPGFTNSSNNVQQRDTTGYGDGGPSHVPAGSGIASAPTAVTAAALPNRRAVDVHWTAPANAAAAGVVGYVVESNTQGTQMVGRDDTYVEFEEGLEGGRTYTFTVYARTPNGNGYRSAPSNAVTIPTGNLVADTSIAEGIADSRPGVPAAPAAPTATAVDQTSVSVAFAAPKSSEPITGYRVTSSGGQVVTGTASPIVVTGLTASTTYTFTVAARNVYGYGPESPASAPVTTPAPPAPTV